MEINLEFAYLVLNFKVHKLMVRKYNTINEPMHYVSFTFGRKYCLSSKNVFVNVEDAIAFCKSIIEKKEASALRRLEHIRNYKKWLDESASCEYMYEY